MPLKWINELIYQKDRMVEIKYIVKINRREIIREYQFYGDYIFIMTFRLLWASSDNDLEKFWILEKICYNVTIEMPGAT